MDAALRIGKFHDLTHFGLRLVVGILFIVHSQMKFDPGFGAFLQNEGLPAQMALPIGLLELVGGALLIVGILSRIASTLLAIDMLGAIIIVKKAHAFSGMNGVELELMLFAILLVIIVLGPGRLSLSHVIRVVPRFLQ